MDFVWIAFHHYGAFGDGGGGHYSAIYLWDAIVHEMDIPVTSVHVHPDCHDYRVLPLNYATTLCNGDGSDVFHAQMLFWDASARTYVTYSVDAMCALRAHDRSDSPTAARAACTQARLSNSPHAAGPLRGVA